MSHNNNNKNKPKWGGAPGGIKRKMPAPKNSLNQEAWDRLKERYDTAHSDTYERTIAKAIKSLSASQDVIATYPQALALAHVGAHCARIICPPLENEQATLVAKPPARNKKKKQDAMPSETIEEAFARQKGDEPPPKRIAKSHAKPTSESCSSNGPSAKELLYQQEKQKAIDKWSLPISSKSHAQGLDWKVVLLIDNREQKSQHIMSKCGMSGIPAEERALPIGDMAWVAQGLRKHKIQGKTTVVLEAEVLLGTIIERKRTDDFVSSFIGTRYNEQRLRLKNAGLPQVLYLIEGDIQKDVHPIISKDRLQMALIETRVEFGFQIVFSTHMDDTVRTLKGFHRRILQRAFPDAFGIADDALPNFGSPDARIGREPTTTGRRRKRRPESLVEMTFDSPPVPAFGQSRFITYEELKAKIERDREAGTRTVGAIHCAMLRQICGNKQVQAIAQDYPTPALLLQAYDAMAGNPKHQAEMHANCCIAADVTSSRRVGPKISHDVYIAYCTMPKSSELPPSSAEEEEEDSACHEKEAATKRAKVQPSKSIAASTTQPRSISALKSLPTTTFAAAKDSSNARKQKDMEASCSNYASNVDLFSSSDEDGESSIAARPWGSGKENNPQPTLATNSLLSYPAEKRRQAAEPSTNTQNKYALYLLEDSSSDDEEENTNDNPTRRPPSRPREKPSEAGGATATDAIELD